MQGLQAQPPVTTPLHGYVQLGCSEDTLLINLLFFLYSYFRYLERK